ncbi:type IV-A pilus assembly ATPase PilB [bacterium]|nr:type IV-A pilus assembly ATPase PilB [bacterium]
MAEDRVGELLLRSNKITMAQYQKAKEMSSTSGDSISSALVKMGSVNENDLIKFVAQKYGMQVFPLDSFELDEDLKKLPISETFCRENVLIPVSRSGQTLIVAMADPSNLRAIDQLQYMTNGLKINPVVASPRQIQETLDKFFGQKEQLNSVLGDLNLDAIEFDIKDEEEEFNIKAAEDAPVVKLVNQILTDAIVRGASDIHIEPYEKSYRVRYRIDGVLQEMLRPPAKLKNAITSRIKIMSNLDIAERRVPQDGRIKLKLPNGKDMDYRVSVLPTLFGEKIVCRLLDKENLRLDMTKLGFEEFQLKLFKEAIERPYGMVLVTGPTGSGKTNTLYSALSSLNRVDINISTAEDPVEFNLDGINQVNVNDDVGLTFAASLRSFLRQDPDVILVGEIRDFETGEIGVKAALTGHMVLSTLHTNDAPATVTRLLNMGIEPFLVTASLNLVVAQRLGRRVCVNCKIEDTETSVERLIELGMDPQVAKTAKVYKGKGCQKCNGSGYKGRVGFYEVLPVTDEIKEAVLNGVSSTELKKIAIAEIGFKTLRQAALTKLLEGITSVAEVLRNTAAD